MVCAVAENNPATQEYDRLLWEFGNLGNEPDDDWETLALLNHAFSSRYAGAIFRGPNVPPIAELQNRVRALKEQTPQEEKK